MPTRALDHPKRALMYHQKRRVDTFAAPSVGWRLIAIATVIAREMVICYRPLLTRRVPSVGWRYGG